MEGAKGPAGFLTLHRVARSLDGITAGTMLPAQLNLKQASECSFIQQSAINATGYPVGPSLACDCWV